MWQRADSGVVLFVGDGGAGRTSSEFQRREIEIAGAANQSRVIAEAVGFAEYVRVRMKPTTVPRLLCTGSPSLLRFWLRVSLLVEEFAARTSTGGRRIVHTMKVRRRRPFDVAQTLSENFPPE